MATIAVIANAVATSGSRPFVGKVRGHAAAFWHLIRIGRIEGLTFVVARRADWLTPRLVLRRGYTHDGKRWHIVKNVGFDAILPRADLRVSHSPPLVYWNAPEVWKVCADKWLTYQRFRSVSPRTWFVNNGNAVRRIQRSHSGQTFVLKPRFGRQSRGVRLLQPGQTVPRSFSEPMLLQEVISGRALGGWPGVVDFRCFVQNGRLDLIVLKRGLTRYPLLDFHHGAKLIRTTVATFPSRARAFVRTIDRTFQKFQPRHYCIDFRFDHEGKPTLIELNHLPVLPWGGGHDDHQYFHHLCSIIRSELGFSGRGTKKMVYSPSVV